MKRRGDRKRRMKEKGDERGGVKRIKSTEGMSKGNERNGMRVQWKGMQRGKYLERGEERARTEEKDNG